MKKVIACFVIFATILFACPLGSVAQNNTATQQKPNAVNTVSKDAQGSDALDELEAESNVPQAQKASADNMSFHQLLKTKSLLMAMQAFMSTCSFGFGFRFGFLP